MELEFGMGNCNSFTLGVKHVNLPLSGKKFSESFTELLRLYFCVSCLGDFCFHFKNLLFNNL